MRLRQLLGLLCLAFVIMPGLGVAQKVRVSERRELRKHFERQAGSETMADRKIEGLLESALYVDDVARSAAFYKDVLELEELFGDDRMRSLAVADKQVLLLMKKGAATEPLHYSGGMIPPSDASGRSHIAFAVQQSNLQAWEQQLASHGVAIESRVHWQRGGESVYFRDPDGHLLEFVTPGCWPIY